MVDVLRGHALAYREFWRLNFLTLLEYRFNFFIWLFFSIVYHGVALSVIWITMHRFPSLNGWHWADVFFLYTVFMLSHTVNNLFFFSVGWVPTHVREGDFDRFLVRPLEPLFQVLSQPGEIYPDEVAVAIVFFLFAQAAVHIHWTLGSVLLLLCAVGGGALIDFAIQLFIGTLGFWVVRIDSLRWVVMGLENDFTRYPISIYNRAVQIVMTLVLPFAFMNYFPTTTLLHKDDAGVVFGGPIIGWLTPAVGVVCFSLAYAFWRTGIDQYQGTGS